MDKDLYALKYQIQEFVNKYQINDISVYIEKETEKSLLDEEIVTKRNVFISAEV